MVAIGTSSTMPHCNQSLRTVDSDVIVNLIGKYYNLTKLKPDIDLWIAFGTGRNFQFYSINNICFSLSKIHSRAIPVFHANTGCDTTSAFRGKGKKISSAGFGRYTGDFGLPSL